MVLSVVLIRREARALGTSTLCGGARSHRTGILGLEWVQAACQICWRGRGSAWEEKLRGREGLSLSSLSFYPPSEMSYRQCQAVVTSSRGEKMKVLRCPFTFLIPFHFLNMSDRGIMSSSERGGSHHSRHMGSCRNYLPETILNTPAPFTRTWGSSHYEIKLLLLPPLLESRLGP